MYVYPKKYDVIVIGAGHAGVEAALAAARMGCQTLLLTMNVDSIGQMSCNPAIGGLGKGHLVQVRIDALGGEMGKATDMTGLQFRMLNTKKGPAVWSPRAQCDKKSYQFRIKWICESEPNLDVKQGQSSKILHKDGEAFGVETSLEVQYHEPDSCCDDWNIFTRPNAHWIKPAVGRTCWRFSGDEPFRFAQRNWTRACQIEDWNSAAFVAPVN